MFEDDLDIFFTDFAVSATYTPQGGTAKSIKVIFDTAYEEVLFDIPDREIDINKGASVMSAIIRAICKSNDIAGARANDTMHIKGEKYYIIDIQPDGTGITTATLSRDKA